MTWRPLSTVVALFPFSILSAQHPSRAEVQTAIGAGNASYIAAFAKADAEALAKVYDPAGARLSPQGAQARGRAAIAAEIREFVKTVGPVNVVLTTADLWVVDDLASETGKWSYTFTPPKKPTATIGGRYVTVWKRQPDGGWRILADLGVPGTTPSS